MLCLHVFNVIVVSVFMRETLSFLFFLLCMTISAQKSQYDEMRGRLTPQSLPLVNITVDVSAVNTTDYVSGEIEITDYQRRTAPSSETVRYHCLYRIRGGSSASHKKKSFAVKLTDENGEDLNANILGIREENSWILDAMAIDRIRMRNRLCFDVWNEISKVPYDTKYDNRNGTEGEFVEVFVNGNYNGLYCLTDKIDRKLLGLKKVKKGDDGKVQVRGVLYKGINWKSGYNLLSYTDADVNKDVWNAWELQYPDDYPSIDAWQPLMNLIDFCSSKTSYSTFCSSYRDFFYTDNLLDYVLFTVVMNVGDNGYKNTFLSIADVNESHRFLLSPWDMDMSLGGMWNGDYDDSFSDIDRYNYMGPFNRLVVLNVDGFRDALCARWAELYETLFSVEEINSRLDYYANMFVESGAWERERNMWDGKPVPLKASLFDEIRYVKDWYARNYVHLCELFDAETTGFVNMADNQPPGELYTLDGRKAHSRSLNQLTKGVYIVNGKKVLVR